MASDSGFFKSAGIYSLDSLINADSSQVVSDQRSSEQPSTETEQEPSLKFVPGGNTSDQEPAVMSVSSSTTVNMPSDPVFGELDGELTRIGGRIDLKNLSIKQLYTDRWSKMKSWTSFIDTNRMRVPTTTIQWTRRLVKNVDFFASNYMCVFLILVIYCVLTSPLLLLAIAASLGACYIVTLKNAESPFKLLGRELTLSQQYIMVSLISFPLFYLAGAGSAVFWVIGASFFVIGLHATLFAIESIDTESGSLTGTDGASDQVLFSQPFTGVETV